MSDSEPATLPSDAVIERSLRHAVQAIHKSGKEEDLTVKRVRTRAEKELHLPSDFLKSDKIWKQRSSTVIKDAVNNLDIPEPAPTPKKAAPTPKKTAEPKVKDSTKKGVKRKASAPAPKVTKRKKTTTVVDEIDSDILSDADIEPPKKTTARRAKKVVAEDSEDEDGDVSAPNPSKTHIANDGDDDKADTIAVGRKDDVSESEMSSLIDESPAKKKRQKASQDKAAKSTKSTKKAPKPKATSKAKPTTTDDPDAAEIKKLQSWLVKCGIRKVWGKELAPFSSSKEKINHLKGLLKDAGMDGRFSDEKAARIKEQRELASDLEAIQVMNETWGQSAESGGRPRRRAAQAAKPIILKQPKFSDESEGDDNDTEGGDEESGDSNNDESDGGSGSESEPAGDDSD